MTTVELQAQHWQDKYNQERADKSRLEGEKHALKLEIELLLGDIGLLRDMLNERNLIIAGLEQLLLGVETD